MNGHQRLLAALGLIAVACTLVFVPWEHDVDRGGWSDRVVEYGAIWGAPWADGKIRWERVGLNVFAVALVVSEIIVLLRRATMARLFSFQGRLSRAQYLIPHLVVLALIVVFGYLFENRFLDKASRLPPVLWYPCGVAFPVAAVMLVVFSFSHLVRRLHDLEEPSWMALVALVPIINIPLLWRVYFREGGSGNGSGNADLSAGLANKPMQTDGPSGRR